jgi:hypothetical protein
VANFINVGRMIGSRQRMPCGGLLGRNVLRQAHRALRLFCLSLGGSGSRRHAVEYPVCLLQGAAKRGRKSFVLEVLLSIATSGFLMLLLLAS